MSRIICGCPELLQKIFSGVVIEHVHVADVSHHSFRVSVAGGCHDFIQPGMVYGRAGYEACPQ